MTFIKKQPWLMVRTCLLFLFLIVTLFTPRQATAAFEASCYLEGATIDDATCRVTCQSLFFQHQSEICSVCTGSGCIGGLTYTDENGTSCAFRGDYTISCVQYYNTNFSNIIRQREGQVQSSNNWSCVLEYNKSPDKSKSTKGLIRLSDTVDCINLKGTDVIYRDESLARKACEGTCDGTASAPYACYFVTTLTCNEFGNTPTGQTIINPFELPRNFSALNRLGGLTVSQLIGRIIRVAMGVIGSITLVIFITGGLIWMTSRGNTQLADKAKKMITWGALGVIVVLTSYAVVNFIFEAFRT